MQRTPGNYHYAQAAGKHRGTSKPIANNKDLDGLIPPPVIKKVHKKSALSIYRERLLRSKQLNETSELVCISSTQI